MIADQFHIQDLIPQRAPMIMITALIDATEKSATTEFVINSNNVLVEQDILSEAGLIENIAQTAAAQAGYMHKKMGVTPPLGFIAAIKDLNVYERPTVNSKITTRVEIINQVFDVTIMKGEIEQYGKILCSCEMKIFIKPRP